MHHHYRQGRPTIGVLAGWQFYRTATNLSYLAPVFRGISRAAQDLGCNLLLGCGIGPSASPSDPLRPAWPELLPEVDFVPIGPWNTDGILIANPLHTQARSDYIQEMIAARHPVLFIGSGETGPTIVADNAGGIQEAMHHLLGHGHTHIAFIAGSHEDLGGDSGDRLAAYQSFVKSHGMDGNPLLVAYGRHVYDGGYSAMQELLNSGATFTAILASNDESALGAMQALEEAGRKIPQDVAIIGFDNRLEGAVHEPGLSSVHVPLFNMGYQALKRLFDHLESQTELSGTNKVETRLVARASCGCGTGTFSPPNGQIKTRTELAETMADLILSQAHRLTDDECQGLCSELVNSFAASIQQGNGNIFQDSLVNVLQRTTVGEDDAHIWQEAVSLLGKGVWGESTSDSPIHEMLNAAQFTISAQMQRQYRNYVLHERWTSSRLSLLTDRLLDALDEEQIHEILAKHLPDLNIHTAMLALLEAEKDDPVAWSHLRNAIAADQSSIHFRSREFPPQGLLNEQRPFQLTLIPLVAHDGQLGYMVFGTEQLDLYGAIVQQLGGAFNTARLYRQAVEDRQLAEEASRMKSRFLSTISHELRTPLNLIVGLSGILLRENEEGDSPLPEPVQRDVERIQAYAQHLGGLIGDVLDLATSDAGQLRLNKGLVNLGDALRMVSESGRQLAVDKGLSWSASIPKNGAWVWGDLTRLRQVALNLVNNAIKFTTSGEIRLKIEIGDATVTVIIHDTGLGIPLEDQDMIFSEFSRSERSIQLGYKGLGLGLAICKRLVELHDGTIDVKSTGKVGEGSTFYFTLPTIQPSAEQLKNLNHSDLDTGDPAKTTETIESMQVDDLSFTILVVDNEPNTLELHTRIVQSHSLSNRVLQARNGQEALETLERENIDLVLLDLQMPEMDGFEVLEKMRVNERMQKIPVIVVTGQVLTEAEMARLNRGVVSILEKGLFGLDETVAHISAALEHRHRLSNEAQRLVRKAMAFIHEKYADPISRRDIAKHVSIAEDYLTFCFRQELGTTPIKYLQRYRVNRAKGLLKENQNSITEIARLVGFSDSGYFSRVFHRETGMSPEAFRRCKT
jgi:signal transduction histidine kinase/DNA-binding LacI/PurR family transcriptional regulator/AraC-like DNA-binding protein